jgi:hypothetical protein
LSDKDVRLAVSWAFNRERLLTVFGPVVGEVPNGYVVKEGPFWALGQYNAEIREDPDTPFQYAPEKATELLLSKGFTKNADGMWLLPNGDPWVLTINSRIAPQYKEVGIEAASQLQAFGIDVQLTLREVTAYIEDWNYGRSDMEVSCRGHLYNPTLSMWQMWRLWKEDPDAITPIGEEARWADGGNRYYNAELQALLEELDTIPDTDPRANELYEEIEAIAFDEVLYFVAFEFAETSQFNPTYWTGWPTPEDNYVLAYPYGGPVSNYIYFNLESTMNPPPPPPTPGISDVQLGMSTPLLGKLVHPVTGDPLVNTLVEIKETTDDVTFTTVALTRTDEDGNYFVTLTPSSTGEFDYWLYRITEGGTYERAFITTITVTSLADELSTQLEAMETTLGTQIEDTVEDATADLTAQITSLSTMVYGAIGIAIVGIIIAIVAVMKK